MAIIKGFRATTIWKAFILNSLAASIIIVLALFVKGELDNYTIDHSERTVKHSTTWYSILITFIVTFITTFAAYTLLYFVFGFGGAMTVSE